MTHSNSPSLLATLTFLLLVAWGVHWHTFSRLELGLDGDLSVDLARSPLRDMVAFTARDVHPPLFYALLKGWLLLSGAHYLTAKYLAIAASLPVLPLLFQLGRRMLPRRAAVIAVLLLAVAPASLFLAPTVRDFSLGLTLSVATAVLTLDMCRTADPASGRQASRLIALALLTTSALLTWYFHLFLLAGEALALLLVHRRFVAAHVALLAGCLAASPWYGYVLTHVTGKLLHGTTTFGAAPALPHPADLANGLARALFGQPVSAGIVIAAVGWLVMLLLGVLVPATAGNAGCRDVATASPRSDRGSPAVFLLVGALTLGTLEVTVTTLRWSNIDSLSRYVLPLLPYISLLQARAFAARQHWRLLLSYIGLAMVVPAQLVWFASLVTSPPIDWAHDAALAYVAQHSEPGDGILFNDRARRARYLLDGGGLPEAVVHTAGQAYLADPPAQAQRVVSGLIDRTTRIWLVQNSPSIAVAQRTLAAQAFGLPPMNVGGSDVQLFLTQFASPLQPVGVTLGGVIALDRAGLPRQVAAGAALPVEIDWRSVRSETVPYTVFVHLEAPSGATVAQYDSPPQFGLTPTNTWQPGQTVADRFAVPIAASVPAGTYTVRAGLYSGPTRLTLPSGVNFVDLGPVRVGP